MIKLEKIEDYPNYSEVLDKEAKFMVYDPVGPLLLFNVIGFNIRILLKCHKEMVCSYERVSDLLNANHSEIIRIEEFESDSNLKAVTEYQFIKES